MREGARKITVAGQQNGTVKSCQAARLCFLARPRHCARPCQCTVVRRLVFALYNSGFDGFGDLSLDFFESSFRVNLGFSLDISKLHQREIRLDKGLYKLYTDQFCLKIVNAKSHFLLSFSLFQVFASSCFVYVCLILSLFNCLTCALNSCLLLC